MKKNVIVAFLSMGVLFYGCQKQAEHPSEHPEKQEHPSEHPEEKKESRITTQDIALAAEKYIKSQYVDGYFLYKDPNTQKVLKLKLDRIHKERLSPIGNNTYFVCADFIAEDGTRYDLDFFMKGETPDNLEVYDLTVHKINGNPLYVWVKVGEVWQRKYE
ncbi:MAG: hypothetical protein GXO22_01270 [Aquificae bacterium]|nr:hypothetical protein [Aquificota bacterium]